jgi:thermostable 8-oxoguanine DNA glycosylase
VLTLYDLEWRLLYSVIVAGKSAQFAERVMNRLMDRDDQYDGPFGLLRRLITENRLPQTLQAVRCGNYTKTERAFSAIVEADLDLERCSAEDLEQIPGIGPKTSRWFLLWTRPGIRHAALDVHVLRWLRDQGYEAPRTTPTGERYRKLEDAFLEEADSRGLTPRELDHWIWSHQGRPDRAEAAPLFEGLQ